MGIEVPDIVHVKSHLFDRDRRKCGIQQHRCRSCLISKPFLELRIFPLCAPVVKGDVHPEHPEKFAVGCLLNETAQVIGVDLLIADLEFVLDQQVIPGREFPGNAAGNKK